MSFGDHLDELRRRMLRSLFAVAVCVLGMMPFKDAVSRIYLYPYRSMWRTGFAAHVERVEKLVAERAAEHGGLEALRQDLFGRLDVERLEWLRAYKDSILDGTFRFAEYGDQILVTGGYKVPYYLVAIGGIEDFWTFMAASMLFSLVLASPFVLYQAWAFIAAGLYAHEKRMVMRYLPLALGLLLAGTSLGYFLAVPYGLYFLVEMMNFGLVQPMFSVANYFRLLFMMTTALGIVFQLPVVMLALVRAGLVKHEALSRHWRYVVVGLFVIAALATPPDPFTQLMMALPMVALYAFGLLLTARAERRMQAAAAGPQA
jgi:Tat protein translocase TatC